MTTYSEIFKGSSCPLLPSPCKAMSESNSNDDMMEKKDMNQTKTKTENII